MTESILSIRMVITWVGHFLLMKAQGRNLSGLTHVDEDGLGHRFEMAVEHDAVVADQVAGHSGWIIQNQKVDTFQSHTIGDNGSFFGSNQALENQFMSEASLKGIDTSDTTSLSMISDGQVYMIGDNEQVRDAIINSLDAKYASGSASNMNAGSDFRADFYMAVDVSDGTNSATVNVRVEYDGVQWKAAEGQVMAGRHSVTASTTDNATVGTDIGEEIVMESGSGTDFLAAAAGSDNYLMMAGSTDGDTTTILETTTAQNIRDAFYNETSVAIDDEDSIQLREQFNIHDVSFERIASGRGINQNTLKITSTNYDGSVDTFELANQYSSFTTSQVEYLVLGQGWEGNGEVYKLHVDGDLSDGVMNGTDESDILVASDHHDGLHMGGGAGDNVLVGADGAQHFKVGYGHDVIKNFNPADGDTIFSFSPLADADAGYERVDSDGNAAADGTHAKYVFANGATLVVENMGSTGVNFDGQFQGPGDMYSEGWQSIGEFEATDNQMVDLYQQEVGGVTTEFT